jgi:hypothetical protein
MKSKIRHDIVNVGVRKFAIAWIYHPETPDVWYLRNGDPGYPGEAEDADVLLMVDLHTLIPEELENYSEGQYDQVLQRLFAFVNEERIKYENEMIKKAKILRKQGKIREAELILDSF